MEYDNDLTLEENVEQRITTLYGGTVSKLSISLAIEILQDIKRMDSWSEEKRFSFMKSNINKICRAAIEIDSKEGAEGLKSISENNVSRSWVDGIEAYRDILPTSNLIP